jgi:hypothetical protein
MITVITININKPVTKRDTKEGIIVIYINNKKQYKDKLIMFFVVNTTYARRVCRLAQLSYKQLGWVQLPV